MLASRWRPFPHGEGESKGRGDYVSEADRASEDAILGVLRERSPGVAILAEESGGTRADLMWAVDPLDGTTNFLHGMPVVGVSVGLLDRGHPVLGAVLAPFLGLEFTGGGGRGVRLNGRLMPALRARAPERAIVGTAPPFRHKERWARYGRVMEAVFQRVEDLRRAGAASVDLAWVASGTQDAFFELGLAPWDVAAGAALVLAAGGAVTDWAGGQDWLWTGDVLAAAPGVHEALLEAAAQAPPG
ncbi:MAG: inositol monophosphatase family protein [Candidatus Dormibacterales bacterium]